MSTVELRYEELSSSVLLHSISGTWGVKSGDDVVVSGISDGDIVFLRATTSFSYEIHSWYALKYHCQHGDVSVDPATGDASVAVACYGSLYGKGLLADSVRLAVFVLEGGLPGGVYLSAMAYAKWPPEVRPKVLSGSRDPGCPRCGHQGEFVRTALCCPQHGPFAGF